MRNESPIYRRQFLAGLTAAGGVALAGCSLLPWTDDDDPVPRFERSEVDSILAADRAVPDATHPTPATPSNEALEDALERVDELLDTVPESIGSETVPNGVVRESIAGNRADAVTARSDAAKLAADERYRALQTTREARADARAAATALEAIDADRDQLLTTLEDDRRKSRETLTDQRDGIVYRGPDDDDGRLRAALFYADREADLDTATHRVERPVDANASVVDIGGGAGDVEFATATATLWDHVTDRYEAETSDRVGLEPVFTSTLEASIDRADGVSLPDQDDDDWLDALVDGEVEQGFDQTLLWEAVRPVYRSRDRLADASRAGKLGTGLREALRFEREYRALERIRDRFEAGDLTNPESIDPIVTERDAAISAAETAIDAGTRPSLAASLLADTVESLGWVDDSIRRKREGDPDHSVSLSDEYSEYVCLRARFEAHAEAVAAFRDRLFDAASE